MKSDVAVSRKKRKMIRKTLENVGRYCLFLGQVFRKPEKWRLFWKQFVFESDKLILSSIVIVGVISVFKIGRASCRERV